MNQSEIKESNLPFDTINELLAMTYLRTQDLTGKSVAEFIEAYQNALQEITAIRQESLNEVINESVEVCLNILEQHNKI